MRSIGLIGAAEFVKPGTKREKINVAHKFAATAVKKIHENRFKIILTQGMNRQIRRMCEVLGYRVTKLKRVRIMDIHLNIRVGEYRNLNNEEIGQLFIN